ncbi:Uncharacterized protein dnl_12720 [Desulfonema limicola]|uniref:Uncharacterized protein n=1 Tax=Desulfonema limicola TaxID=45656 RepID=A0A975B581_9BACT|nr:Uncharacterized protein dnl_12720 [Desulfonema limicola]
MLHKVSPLIKIDKLICYIKKYSSVTKYIKAYFMSMTKTLSKQFHNVLYLKKIISY